MFKACQSWFHNAYYSIMFVKEEVSLEECQWTVVYAKVPWVHSLKCNWNNITCINKARKRSNCIYVYEDAQKSGSLTIVYKF